MIKRSSQDISLPKRRLVYGKARVIGIPVFVKPLDNDNILDLILYICEGEIEGLDNIYFNEKHLQINTDLTTDTWHFPNTADKYYDNISIRWQDGSQTTADSEILSKHSELTDTFIGLGCAYAVIRLQNNRYLFDNQMPKIEFQIRGSNQIASITSPTTVSYSTNPIACQLDYFSKPFFALGSRVNTFIDNVAAVGAEAICEQTVPALTGTQKRYELNGAIELSQSIKAIMDSCSQSYDGYYPYIAGKFVFQAGIYSQPTEEITQDDLLGQIVFYADRAKREKFNLVKGNFYSEENRYLIANYPPRHNSLDDVEEIRDYPLDLDLVSNSYQSQRIAERMLRKINLTKRLELTVHPRFMTLEPGDYVFVTLPVIGLDQVSFIVEQMIMNFSPTEMSITLMLNEYSQSVDEWTTENNFVQPDVPVVEVEEEEQLQGEISNDDSLVGEGGENLIFPNNPYHYELESRRSNSDVCYYTRFFLGNETTYEGVVPILNWQDRLNISRSLPNGLWLQFSLNVPFELDACRARQVRGSSSFELQRDTKPLVSSFDGNRYYTQYNDEKGLVLNPGSELTLQFFAYPDSERRQSSRIRAGRPFKVKLPGQNLAKADYSAVEEPLIDPGLVFTLRNRASLIAAGFTVWARAMTYDEMREGKPADITLREHLEKTVLLTAPSDNIAVDVNGELKASFVVAHGSPPIIKHLVSRIYNSEKFQGEYLAISPLVLTNGLISDETDLIDMLEKQQHIGIFN